MDIPIDQQNIINILGIQNLADEKKLQVIEKVTKLVQNRLVLRIFESLDALRQREFSEILEKDDQDSLAEFLDRFAPNLIELLNEETSKVKLELKEWGEMLA